MLSAAATGQSQFSGVVMSIEFVCPHCQSNLRLKDEYAGRRGQCPKCRHEIAVPRRTAAGEPDATARREPAASWSTAPSTSGERPRAPVPAPSGERTVASDRVRFFCTACGTKMSAPGNARGKQVTCPTCSSKQRIPGGPPAPQTSPAVKHAPYVSPPASMPVNPPRPAVPTKP